MSAVTSLSGRKRMLDGLEIPQVGLGVYEMSDEETYQACLWALESGYRHIDTAEWYENENAAGRAVVDFLKSNPSIPRSAIFFTTKLKTNVSRSNTLAKIRESVKTSTLEYLDLYLLHSPIGGEKMRRECWKGCEDGVREGLVRSIGVSNYGDKHIQEMVDDQKSHGSLLPVLNQIDLHPFMRRSKIVEICEKHDILLEAWAPLVRGQRFNHPVVVKAAKAHGKEPAQVLLRWSIQHGYVPIPKSVSQKRIVSNGSLFDFELTKEEMDELDGLEEYLVTDWDVVDEE